MKKLKIFLSLCFLLAAACAFILFKPTTNFNQPRKLFIISKEETIHTLTEKLYQENIIGNKLFFKTFASVTGISQKLKYGKYQIEKGTNLFTVLRVIRNAQQANIKLVINKLRTKEDLAKLISKNFDTDSVEVIKYLSNNDSLAQFKVDTNTLFTTIIPNTYSFYYTTPLQKILAKLQEGKNNFWTENRLALAKEKKLSPEQVYTLASIVEEESNDNEDRPNIASVYLNRLAINMPLQADPTVKFAMKDFLLKRIYQKHLFYPSAFNTYRNKGLPPGPICTPSPTCIDIVLHAPQTSYLYFVASAQLNGKHIFTTNYTDHLKKAKEYQQALDIYFANKQQP